ncbi:hypothetical protein X797_004577 [Metarhizium robertsii]|uniref:Uncharacterized protein n=1 Tax=Metarhizium robertsii TaxID=568076 RepID=A0A0A1UY04_9HYPO|nr:hypothetical protein X797_004577 [Metarhizium robertsii]
MPPSFLLSAILSIASATAAAAELKPTKCATKVTIVTKLTGTTTIYKSVAAVPWEVDCRDCDLIVITKTLGSLKPTITVTSDFILMHPPICTWFPEAPSQSPDLS